MLLQTVDTLLAFLVLTLLLSLIVTGLVQATQYMLQLRARNLENGIVALLRALRRNGDTFEPQELARQIVHSPLLTQGSAGERVRSRLPFLQTPRTSWVELDELKSLLAHHLPPERIAELETWFKRTERNLSKRFLHNVRWITVVWALLVAFVFQANSFQLLRDLSTNTELRAQLIAGLDEALADAEKAVDEVREYEDVADEALARLEARHSELEPLLEEASGIGSDRESIVAELEEIMAAAPGEHDELVAEYGQILDELYQEGRQRAVRSTQDVLGLTARLGVAPWPKGADFYFGRGNSLLYNWLGVLLMGVLLSFGAPFWFEQLKNVAALRDVLAGKDRSSKPLAS